MAPINRLPPPTLRELINDLRMPAPRRAPSGPWTHEPNRIVFEHAGYSALVLRHDRIGSICGYVAVPKTHPWWGHDHDDEVFENVTVHGGLTYARGHIPSRSPPKIDGLWWIGFDCAHAGDYVPGRRMGVKHDWEVYRDVPFVRAQCVVLANQAVAALKKMAHAKKIAKKLIPGGSRRRAAKKRGSSSR